jgi:hypothetical protein
MSTETKDYSRVAIGLAAALGIVASILVATLGPKLPKLMKGG